MEKKDFYFSRFSTSISGLNIGSPVKYNGIQIGQVEKIRVDREDVSVTVVEISIDQGTPIKKNTRAVVGAMGITGLKYIDLIGSTNAAETIKPRSEIPEGQSFMDNLSGKATDIAVKTETLLQNLLEITTQENRRNFSSILQSGEHIMQELDGMVGKNSPQFTKMIKNIGE